ncbi:MAG: flagellar motor protein MotB [bacterium]
MARKKNKGAEGHENAERWLLTYADMITLLMAFFIMMYSMSVLNMAKFNKVAIAIRSGFGGTLKGEGKKVLKTSSGAIATIAKMPVPGDPQEKKMQNFQAAVKNIVKTKGMENEVTVTSEARGIVISMLADNLVFNRGSADLTPRAYQLLGNIADKISGLSNDILVEGHTCKLPISSARFPSNWELSAARSSRVVRLFEYLNVPSKRMSAVGYGDTRPKFPNTTEDNMMRNRRVDVVILNSNNADVTSGGNMSAEVTPETAPPLIDPAQLNEQPEKYLIDIAPHIRESIRDENRQKENGGDKKKEGGE